MVEEFENAIDRILKFYDKFKNTELIYDPATCKRRSYYYHTHESNGGYASSYTASSLFCEDCETYPCVCRKATIITVTNQYCSHCGSLKIGKFCDDYCELMDSQCSLCDELSCTGMGPCDLCGYIFHNDPYINKFSMCKECMRHFMKVSTKLLEEFELFPDSDAVEVIKGVMYQ